jgi:hypothetical protein
MRLNYRGAMRSLNLVLAVCLLLQVALTAQTNEVLGEIELLGATDVEKTAGVWIDGQYVGYLKELRGSKKILLLPGEHLIVVRQGGYKDFSQRITVQPGQKQSIPVELNKDPGTRLPTTTAEVKLSPDRAAVFVDGVFVGHVGEFGGVGKALLVAPGTRKITIFLTGYETLETQVNLLPNQKFELKTDLVRASTPQPSPPPRPNEK